MWRVFDPNRPPWKWVTGRFHLRVVSLTTMPLKSWFVSPTKVMNPSHKIFENPVVSKLQDYLIKRKFTTSLVNRRTQASITFIHFSSWYIFFITGFRGIPFSSKFIVGTSISRLVAKLFLGTKISIGCTKLHNVHIPSVCLLYLSIVSLIFLSWCSIHAKQKREKVSSKQSKSLHHSANCMQ